MVLHLGKPRMFPGYKRNRSFMYYCNRKKSLLAIYFIVCDTRDHFLVLLYGWVLGVRAFYISTPTSFIICSFRYRTLFRKLCPLNWCFLFLFDEIIVCVLNIDNSFSIITMMNRVGTYFSPNSSSFYYVTRRALVVNYEISISGITI